MAQNLQNYSFEKYEDEASFSASRDGLPVRTSTNAESVVTMVDDDNITMTSLRIVCNCIRDAFGKRNILPEEAVHTLGPGYMEVEYVTYEWDKEKGMDNDYINFWYRKTECLLTSRAYHQ